MTWPARRELYWSTHERRCARCGSTVDVVLHHLRYDWPLGDEPDEALVPLCRRHHLELHQLHAKRPHRSLEAVTVSFVRWGRLRMLLTS